MVYPLDNYELLEMTDPPSSAAAIFAGRLRATIGD